jgi:hypothetical protein
MLTWFRKPSATASDEQNPPLLLQLRILALASSGKAGVQTFIAVDFKLNWYF